MSLPVLHVAFSISGAAELRKALRGLGLSDEVTASCDDLSFGPINPGEPAERAAWMHRNFGPEWAELPADNEAFLRSSARPDVHLVAWFSRRSAAEFAGFLEWLWRVGEQPCDVIDLTSVTLRIGDQSQAWPVPSLGVLSATRIVEMHLLQMAKPLPSDMRQLYQQLWRRLRDENADFRLVSATGMDSAPVDIFDAALLAEIGDEWRKAARVVGRVLVADLEGPIQVNDIALFGRLRALIAMKRIEAQGDPSEMRHLEVRLPRSFPSEVALPRNAR